MLSKMKITIEMKSVVEGKEVHGHRAIVSEKEVTMLPYQIDKGAYKEHRNIIRTDQAEYEDLVYDIQDQLFKNKKG